MRQVVRSILAFAMGASVGRIFDSHFPPGETVLAAGVILLISVAAFIASCRPEMRRWWWLRRTRLMRFRPLRITHVKGLHEFLAEGEDGMRFHLFADQNDKGQPPVREGDRVIVTGKQRERMKGGNNTLVQCRIRTLP